MPREDAKVLGMSFSDLLKRYRNKAKYSMNRDLVRQIIRLLIRPYRENPAIDDVNPAQATVVDMPREYMHMFAGATSDYSAVGPASSGVKTGRFRSTPRLDLFPYLTASFANYMKMGAAESISLRGDTGVPKKDKCLVIMSNSGYATWESNNMAILGNRDTFGKDVYIGTATFREFQEYAILAVPDEDFEFYLRPTSFRSTSNAVVWGPDAANNRYQVQLPVPTAWASLANPLVSSSTMAGITNVNTATHRTNIHDMHTAIVVEPNGFQLGKPKQLEVPIGEYSDFRKQQQKFIFGSWSLEGVRTFDGLVRLLFFTDRGLIGKWNIT